MSALVPRPDILTARRLLAVQPHPDDNEIGAGALLARLCALGCVVRYVTVTDGAMGTADAALAPAELARRRLAEADAAAAVLGVDGGRHLGHRDLVEGPMPSLRQELLGEIAAFDPDFLLTCDPWLPYESHPDHRNVGLAVAEAACFIGFPHVPGAPRAAVRQPAVAFYATAHPNVRIAAGEFWERKWQAIAEHRSQFDPVGLLQLRALVEEQSTGEEGPYEAFKVLHPVYLHFNPAAVTA